jgi:hypothetical protein
MQNLRALLERFAKVLNKDTHFKESVSAVIQARTGAVVSPDKISLKEGVLQIEASPAVKNEIRLKEESIRSELKELHNISISRVLYK